MGTRGPAPKPRLVVDNIPGFTVSDAYGSAGRALKREAAGEHAPFPHRMVMVMSKREREIVRILAIKRHSNGGPPALKGVQIDARDEFPLCILAKLLRRVELGDPDWRACAKDAMAILSKYGCTPADRQRILGEAMAKAKPAAEDDFSEFV